MIELKEIYFNYKHSTILRDINLTIDSNEVIGIVGESGSGKTTLVRMMLGLLHPQQGKIYTNGLQLLPIFQHAYDSFNPKYTIQKSLEEPMQYYQNGKFAVVRDRAKSLMQHMHLDVNLLERYPDQLSGGQLQRFNMIRTLMLQPDMLICDEITASLDVIAEQRMIELLKGYHTKTNKGMIVISHDIAFLNQFVERIIVMNDGAVVDDFKREALFDEQRHPYTKQLLSIY